MPKISVIIPAHNAERYIHDCLKSLQSQTFKDFEIIVINDGSNDTTAACAAPYARVITTPHRGIGAARNTGAQHAQGDILVFTDSDVVVPSRWLERIEQTMRTRQIECCGGGYCGSIGNSFLELFAYYELAYRRKKIPDFVHTLVANNFACSKTVFFASGGFPEKYTCEDMRLSFRISRTNKIFWDKENCVFHHFKTDFKAYLRQQFRFARDTVIAYIQDPAMFLVQTHQGRGIYSEVCCCFGIGATLFLKPLWSLYFLLLIVLINSSFLRFLAGQHMPLRKSILIILARDGSATCGVLMGIPLALWELGRNLLKKK